MRTGAWFETLAADSWSSGGGSLGALPGASKRIDVDQHKLGLD
jgi:hypothetical protein